MKKSTRLVLYVVLVITVGSVLAFRKSGRESVHFQKTDYSVPANWYDSKKPVDESLVDVFYVLPTCVHDRTSEAQTVVSRFADVDDPGQRQKMDPSFDLAQRIFADSANFFAPYYQQVSLEVWFDGKDTLAKYSPYAMDDVKSAFKYYMKHLNNGRRFVLAGFSQGAMGVVELLKTLDRKQYSRMVAAYVVGYKVTQEDLLNPHIVPAKGADDTGVTIVYNSVSMDEAASDALSGGNVVCINPFSWSDSKEPAKRDSLTATISPSGEYLVLDGVSPNDYYLEVMARLLPWGNLHLGELTIYEDVLRDNVKLRMRQ